MSFEASPEITTKQAQLLLEVVPKATRIAVLWNPASQFLHPYWKSPETAAPTLGVTLNSVEVHDVSGLEGAFDSMKRQQADALIVFSDTFAITQRVRIVALAETFRLPAIYGVSPYVLAGGLMSYGPALVDLFQRAAEYVDKILKGAKPADLPIAQPTKFELVVDLKTVKSLGLTIPPSILARADEVIE